ncbi:PhoPQ-activated pathogenicity-like protein PqaA type [Planctomycetota bacterium]|nr:PhoPQ-activated pathogenicity-like protein PqaA type [Planctomycetota bacterium]
MLNITSTPALEIWMLFSARTSQTFFMTPLLLIIAFLLTPLLHSDLKQYVQTDDGHFNYQVIQKQELNNMDVLSIQLQSQQWQGIDWNHWLIIGIPQQLKHKDKAILVITGGSNTNMDRPPSFKKYGQIIGTIANQIGIPLIVLKQVPNQPLYDNYKEDALISYTFEQYLKEGAIDDSKPLLMPMVKSAVKAMDAAQEILLDELGTKPTEFIVTGASKRGWTTWLTGAIDDRVVAIAPLVIDILNMKSQMKHQLASYGDFSDMISDYKNRGITTIFDTPEGKKLWSLVDPYTYRKSITIPKLILLGTNDPYWTVDASSLYVNQLQDPTYLHYVPNTGHSLDLTFLPTLYAFIDSVVSRKPLAKIDWQIINNSLTVSWNQEPYEIKLWTASSESRDFRKSKWTAKTLPISASSITLSPNTPKTGYTATFVEVSFPSSNPLPYELCTEILVTPQYMPYQVDDQLNIKTFKKSVKK